MDHGMKAAELFESGYNCAQAVAVAFCDVTGLEPAFAAKMVSSFGGGFGRLREVCGAVSGMVAVLGLLYGYDTPGDDEIKKAHYAAVQDLCNQFKAQCGSMICRELLDNPPSDPNPTPRTEEFYAVRPCTRYVMTAARLVDAYMEEHPL